MADVKISSFIIGMVLVGLAVAVMGQFMGDVVDNSSDIYNKSQYGENSTFYQLKNLTNTAEETEDKLDIEQPSATDIIGGYFTGGYKALQITTKSISVFQSLLNEVVRTFGLGEHFKIALMTIVIILIFVGVIIRQITKQPI